MKEKACCHGQCILSEQSENEVVLHRGTNITNLGFVPFKITHNTDFKTFHLKNYKNTVCLFSTSFLTSSVLVYSLILKVRW